MNELVVRLCCTLGLCMLMVPTVYSASNPSIAVIIVEKIRSYGSGFEQPGSADNSFNRQLVTMGFSVVDTATIRENADRQRAALILQGDENAARQVALKHDAQYLITGTATSRPAGGELFNTQMKSLQAAVNVKLIRTSDGRVLGGGGASAAKPHLDEVQGGILAIEEASDKAFAQLSSSLSALLVSTDDSNTRGKVVHISGLKSFQHLNFIIEFMQSEFSDGEVELANYNDGIAELQLSGGANTSVIALQLARKRFKSFKIDPYNVSANRIDATINMIQR